MKKLAGTGHVLMSASGVDANRNAGHISGMDPVTHTFVGAVLGETRLCQTTAYSRLTLIVAANLPDIDAVTYFISQDTSLYWRRGWTHGALAMLLLPLLWTGAVLGLARLRGRQEQVDPRWVLALSYIGLLSHPALDWLNNYGVRLLMPFSGTWFYGDAVFIVDPWMWMLLGGFLFLRRSRRTSLPALAWTLFALAATAAVVLGPGSQLSLQLAWMAGLTAIVLLDWARPSWLMPSRDKGASPATAKSKGRRASDQRVHVGVGASANKESPSRRTKESGNLRGQGGSVSAGRAAPAVLALLLIYILANLGLTSWSESQMRAAMQERGQEIEKMMASPVPLNPLVRDVVIQTRVGYHYGRLHPLSDPPLQLASRLIPKLPEDDPRVQRAIRQPQVRGIVNWSRFPWAVVERRENSDRVYIMDARYVRRPTTGFGGAMVELERQR
ncbi:MAG TPA: metal-dependent hydrolase [Acidobacteriota bacterium]|nr:metal-dependent hydrolase [Acidobacteriota bacterium]